MNNLIKKIAKYIKQIWKNIFNGKEEVINHMSIHGYFDSQKKNLNQMVRFEPFAVLFPIVDELYNRAIQLVPKNLSPIYGRFLLVCHKSFLSSIGLIGQCQADDAAPITRRAIEVAKLAAALKESPDNLEKWMAYEERMERWQARQEGKKPKGLHIQINVENKLVHELMETLGILSDSEVHFTPEYFDSLSWRKSENSIFLNYFIEDQKIIERDIVIMSGTYIKILKVLNWCLDDVFMSNHEWLTLHDELYEKGKKYSSKFGGKTDV